MSKTANNIIFLLLFIEQEIISVIPLQAWIKWIKMDKKGEKVIV